MPGGSCPGIPVGGKPGWGRRKNNPVWRQTLATRRGFVPQEGARNRERRLRPRFPEIEKAARRAAAKPEQGRGLITSFCSENKKMSEQSGLCSDMARPRGVEPPAYRLGATSFGSCLVVRHASKCPQTRMNTGFFIELPVAEYLKISPNIGSFCTQIEPAIRQILDRFSVVTPNTGDSLELSYPII